MPTLPILQPIAYCLLATAQANSDSSAIKDGGRNTDVDCVPISDEEVSQATDYVQQKQSTNVQQTQQTHSNNIEKT